MAKKRKRKGWLISKKQVNDWLGQATDQLMQKDYAAAERTCKRILRYVPAKVSARGEALEYLAMSYSMRKQFEEASQALSQALEINPQHAHLWYNRGLIEQYNLRLVQAIHDFEKALELEENPAMRERYTKMLIQTREMAEEERALRGPDFTLEALQEQQVLFSQGVQLMQQEKWAEAETVFRQVIEMGDILPQPQGNLGLALLMQQKYDQAEAAFKRALEIEPTYDLAQNNLAVLPLTRETGQRPQFLLRNFANEADIKLTLKMLDAD